MEYDGEVVFGVKLDPKDIKDSLKGVTSTIQSESKKWDTAVDQSSDNMASSFGDALKSIGLAISAAAIGKKLLQIGKDALQAASDLEEVQNVVDVTFGESSATIDKWAKNAGAQFGLTETQAKKFASTLGAMMKSAGMSGNEIVEMSTDLAGLAADMASFYNLDFETAFQKIRSGISGETEPLKQLGVNMSVANLEAFALTQGITKAFDKMSQGEQTMLRYQYLMQATADAQGDFARTSDGYANSLRKMETNIESLKTKLGTVLIPKISEVVQAINGMLEDLTPKEGYKTVLDEFAEIDLQTEAKLAEIQKTAQEANALSATLADISHWAGTSGNDGLNTAFDSLPDEEKVSAWNDMFSAVASHAQEIVAASSDGDATATWLAGLADSANKIDPSNAEAWGTLFTSLSEGLTALNGTVEGNTVLQQLTQDYLAMGTESAAGTAGLLALGYSSEEIAIKQEQWLKTCKQLVKTIPELNSVINAETGEIDGGIKAVEDYVDAWETSQKKLLMQKAMYAKQSALIEKQAALASLELDALIARNRVNAAGQRYDMLGGEYVPANMETAEWKKARDELFALQDAAEEAKKNFEAEKKAVEEATAALEEGWKIVNEMPDPLNKASEATEGLTESVRELTTEEKNNLTTALSQVIDAYDALSEYIEKIRDESASAIAQTVHGFENIITPADKVNREMTNLTKQMEELKAQNEDTSALEKTFQALEGSVPSIQNMTAALQSQLTFLDRYNEALAAAKARGVSDAVLAALADGSPESLDYLEALGKGAMNDGDIEELNKMYAEVQSKSQGLANTLADTKLKVDETFTDLSAKAKEAVQNLDQSAAAAEATGSTVDAIITTLQEKKALVDSEVDAINASIARLGQSAMPFGMGSSIFQGVRSLFKVSGSHATGLDYVPFDNYLAQLHEGEAVLTAEEARVWRAFQFGQSGSRNVDYDALGATMRDNVKTGGNVYLDGQTVGRVISARQANDYRQLERSGWQQ